MNRRPPAGLRPPPLLAAYGASRFHFAEPELSGLGVTTSTPGRNRSSQSLMFFGLPLRTTSVTTDPNGMPLLASVSQSAGDLAGLDQSVDVGLNREVHDVGRLSRHHAAGLIAGGAVGGDHLHAPALLGGIERRNHPAPAGFWDGVGDQSDAGVRLGQSRRRRWRHWRRHGTPRRGRQSASAPTTCRQRDALRIMLAFRCGTKIFGSR